MAWETDFGWLHLIVEYLIKSTAVLTLALILVLIFRKESASLRHFVLSLSLAGLLLLPVLPSLGLGWETGLLPAKAGHASLNPAPREADAGGEQTAEVRKRENQSAFPAGPAVTPENSASYEWAPGKLEGIVLILKSAIPFVWSVGLVFLLLRLAAGIFGAFRLIREGETVRDPRWSALLERFLAAIHLRRDVRLKSHPGILVPLTWGFIKPFVLIPDEHKDWTEEQCSSALIHELGHIKRGDFLVMLIVRLSLAAFWFNPLSWFVFRRLKNEQEEACDELVLRMGIKPSTYAANLLFFKSAAGSRLGQYSGLLGLSGHGKSAFNERLTAILKQKWSFQEVKMKTKMMLVCAVVLAVGIVGMARPSPALTGKAEPGTSVLFVGGPGAVEKTVALESRAVREAKGTQEQSQTEEKKVQEKEPSEQAQKEHQIQEQKGQKEQFLSQEKQKQEKKFQEQEEQELKEKKKKAVVWTIKEGEKDKLRIKIQEGDEVKTIVIDKPVIVKEIKDGKVFLITPEGEEVKILEGDPVHLEIKGDKLEFIKEGKILKVGKEGSSFYVNVNPDIDISEAIKVALKDIPDIDEAVRIALKNIPGTGIPINVKVGEIARPHISWVSHDMDNEIREKLREVREKLRAVEEKKMELREVDEALADLEKDLDKMSREIEKIGVELEDKPVVYKITKKAGEEEADAKVHVDINMDFKKDGMTVIAHKKGSFTLSYWIGPGNKGCQAYDNIVARVKKDLPEGFTLDPEFDKESGRVTLKISGPSDEETPEDLVKKITESIRDEIKGKKE